MKQLFKIASFLLLLFLLTAEDCSDSTVEVTKEDRMSGMFQNIENEFIEDEPAPETIMAFEKRAVQKLKDLTDFLNIYANANLDKEFRVQAGQMIYESFYLEFDVQKLFKVLELVEDTTAGILYHSKNGETFNTEINLITVSSNFQQQSVSGFKGELRFSQKVFSIFPEGTTLRGDFIRQIEILLQKTEKEFGNEIQTVWEVYLGEIR
jgi:hypothetical protein